MPSGRMPLIAGVDIGTSGIRCLVTSADGRTVSAGHVRRALGAQDGFDPDDLTADVVSAVRSAVADSDVATSIVALGVAGHGGTVLVDRQRQVIAEGFGWSDARGVQELARVVPADSPALRRTGRPAITSGALAAVTWLAKVGGGADRIRWVLSPKDYVLMRLTGEVATDATSAAHTLGFDVTESQWDRELLGAGGLSEAQMPPVHAGSSVIGRISADGARATGLPAGLPVAAGGPDGTVGAAAVAGTRQDLIVDIAGTTDVIVRVASSLPQRLNIPTVVNPYVVEGLWTSGGPTGLTGGAVPVLCELLGCGEGASAAGITRPEWESVEPGSEGLMVDPQFTGARFPWWQPDRTGSMRGLRAHHTAAHVLRAAQEGAAFVVRAGVDLLAGASGSGLPVVIAGGMSRSMRVAQLRADILGRPLLVYPHADASVRGAAALAALAKGMFGGLDDAVEALGSPAQRVDPDPRRHEYYEQVYRSWSGCMVS